MLHCSPGGVAETSFLPTFSDFVDSWAWVPDLIVHCAVVGGVWMLRSWGAQSWAACSLRAVQGMRQRSTIPLWLENPHT